MSSVVDKIKVYVAVPTNGVIADAQVWFWRAAEKLYKDRIEFIWPDTCVRRIFHDFSRNCHVENFLASPADILFFLDSDVVPPDDVFDLVIEHDKWKVAGAPYPIFMTTPGIEGPQIIFTAYKGLTTGGVNAADIPNEGKEFIDGLATGCLFIKREIFEGLQKPYFAFEYDHDTRCMTAGEDLSFCRKVRELGHKFYVDYSKVCRHYKSICLLEMNNYARQYAKRSVEQYDAMIKPALLELQQRLKAKPAPSRPITPDGPGYKVPADGNRELSKIIQKFRT